MADSQTFVLQCLQCHKLFGPEHGTCPDDNSLLVAVKKDPMLGKLFAERYEILSVAGKGGMATVYRARHKYTERELAVKLMHGHLVDDPTWIKRFQLEAKAASSLNHPNIISVYDFGITNDGDAYLVMDYLNGCSLSRLIDTAGYVHEFEAIDIFRQTCKGLLHAHHKGVLHRDLKPANLVLLSDEDATVLVKIVDFGIAKLMSGGSTPTQSLTKTGDVLGSPLYMSPEQWNGEKLDVRSDIYSFGCLAYEMLTGGPPLAGPTALDTMALHLNEKPVTFKEFNPNVRVSDKLEAIVLKCLEKKREKRYDTTLELLKDLNSLEVPQPYQGESVAMRVANITAEHRDPSKPRTPSYFIKNKFRFTYERKAKVFGFTLLALLSFIFLYQGPDEDPGPPASKLIWELEVSTGHAFLANGLNTLATPLLEFANWHANNLDLIFRRPNYEKLFQTLNSLGRAYNAAGNTTKFQEILDKTTTLERKRWETKALVFLDKIKKSEDYLANLRKSRSAIQAHLSEPELNWASSVRAIVEIARRLDAVYSYELEYQLLYKTKHLLKELYGSDFVGVASIETQRAECLKNQDRIDVIDAKPDDSNTAYGIYGHIAEIWDVNTKKNLGLPPNSTLTIEQIATEPDLVRAILKLGQWQRRRNQYADSERSLNLAVQAAERSKEFAPDELAEFYSSYANLMDHMNRPEVAIDYRKKAKEERRRSAKQFGLEYIEHVRTDE